MEFVKEQDWNNSDGYFRILVPVKKAKIGKHGDKFYIYQDEKSGRYIVQLVLSKPDPVTLIPRDMG